MKKKTKKIKRRNELAKKKRGKRKGLFTTLIIIGIVIIGAVAFLSFYSKKQVASNNSSVQNSTQNSTDLSQAEDQKQESTQNQNSQSQPQTTPKTTQSSAETVLNDFLKVLISPNKTSIVNYCSTDFKKSNFIKGILAGTLTAPNNAQLINLQSKEENVNYSYIVNEDYNIDKTNNAGVNGSYIYTLKLENNQWKIFSRE